MNGWARVVAAVVDRRAELGMTQKDLAVAARVSERTIQNLEGGSRPQAPNRSKIERALGWGNGEMLRIEKDGGTRLPPVPPELEDLPDLVERIRSTVPPDDQERVMAAIARELRGEPQPPKEPGAVARSQNGQRRAG